MIYHDIVAIKKHTEFWPRAYVIISQAEIKILSALLDAFDGHAARILNQCSKFGAMLDMLTDRVATSMLLMALSVLYPKFSIL